MMDCVSAVLFLDECRVKCIIHQYPLIHVYGVKSLSDQMFSKSVQTQRYYCVPIDKYTMSIRIYSNGSNKSIGPWRFFFFFG